MRIGALIGLLGGLLLSTTFLAADPPGGCPPGLAKKDPACVPPGTAKKGPPYRVGDRIDGDYRRIDRPWRYGLDRDGTYYRIGDQVVRVDEETREVLDLIGVVGAVLD